MASDTDPLKLSSPRVFLFRMLVFVMLGGVIAFLLQKQIQTAFLANPGLFELIPGPTASPCTTYPAGMRSTNWRAISV